MKLVDFIAELDKKRKSLPNRVGGNKQEPIVLGSENLRTFEKQLFECDEFKNVVRINFIDLPSYLVDNETGEPISTNRHFLGGDTSVKSVVSYKIFPNQELKFNKIIDLYSISISKIYTKTEDINKPGVWVYPTTYNPETFTPKNQIRVIWDQQQLEQTLSAIGSDETPKERILRMFKDALETMEPNLPCEYAIHLRCSERSVLNHETEDMEPNKQPSGSVVYTGSTQLFPAFGISSNSGDSGPM